MSKSQQQLEKSSQKTVVDNADFIVENLLEHDRFYFSMIADEGSWKREVLRKLQRKNIIVSVSTEQYKVNGNFVCRDVWTLKYDAAEKAVEVVENRDARLPCGHSGIRNVRNGPFECLYRGCSRQFERADGEFVEVIE